MPIYLLLGKGFWLLDFLKSFGIRLCFRRRGIHVISVIIQAECLSGSVESSLPMVARLLEGRTHRNVLYIAWLKVVNSDFGEPTNRQRLSVKFVLPYDGEEEPRAGIAL
jgi:hypothetical protein